MGNADLDPTDLQEFRAFLETRGLAPAHFQAVASEGDPEEGLLGPSRRSVTVSHTPTDTTRTYSFRTWVADFKADHEAGAFAR